MPPTNALSDDQIRAENLTDWRKLAQALHARYLVPDLAAGARFVDAVARASGVNRPTVRLSDAGVDLTLATRGDGVWVTADDVDYARAVSDLAVEYGLVADPGGVVQVELGLDAADSAPLAPFWAALLTGDATNTTHGEVLDPTVDVPNLWFQGTAPHDTPRQRWHLDVWLAPEVADARVAAAVAAGGTVVDDSGAPSFTVLADPDGNRACVCTSLGR